ncbi:MAG: J domain-containing protein [Alphaproteobacteria bacterium]|nr:J domain-containing protein [Alphaproteobacteria bacterium]MBM3654263.1 J domain-containing protein [Alphaproteobacteria bacterium]
MNLNSPLFDRIRTQREPREAPRTSVIRCDSPGCEAEGAFRAPMGRLREGQYFCFCLEHVREYNATYNYFNGMDDATVARYMKDATVGHRPTWSMGTRRGQAGFREDPMAAAADPLGVYRQRFRRPAPAPERRGPRHSPVTIRAFVAMGLEETADKEAIRARYKELVKRHHPDANGGDRSREEKLREIIHAYKTLRAARLV